jgi:hypothetical protein
MKEPHGDEKQETTEASSYDDVSRGFSARRTQKFSLVRLSVRHAAISRRACATETESHTPSTLNARAVVVYTDGRADCTGTFKRQTLFGKKNQDAYVILFLCAGWLGGHKIFS